MDRPDEHCSLLLVNDDPNTSSILARQLRAAGFSVASRSGVDALDGPSFAGPDVVILDTTTADVDAVAVCRAAVEKLPSAVIVVLGPGCDVEYRLRAFEAGAFDFLAKPFVFAELLARLRVHLRARRRAELAGMLCYGPIEVHPSCGLAWVDSKPCELPKIQRRILAALVARPERVLTLSELQGVAGSAGDEGAIRKHVERLRGALGGAGSMIRTVRGAGYRISRVAGVGRGGDSGH